MSAATLARLHGASVVRGVVLRLLTVPASLVLCMLAAHASAPQVKTQAPGFYRMMLGDFEITALSDGTFDLDTSKMLTHVPREGLAPLLTRSFAGNIVPVSVNAYLINMGDRLILADTGAAGLFGPTLGRLASNLLASGYRPEQVDAVILTHMHPDHVGGLLLEGRRAFPNATVYAEHEEADFWLGEAARARAGTERQPFFIGAEQAIAPYLAAGRFQKFSAPAEICPGVRAIAAPGHTPGHTLFSIESKGNRLVIWGDLMEIEAVQFSNPAVTIVFDENPAQTAAQRPRAYRDAAREKYFVAAAHLPFPGIGHVRAETTGYSWVPITYDIPR